MELELSLVIIPYPDRPTTKIGCPFSKDYSILSNTTLVRIYVDKLYVAEGKSITAKLFVCLGTLSAAFNSLEFAHKANEFDGEVRVCNI